MSKLKSLIISLVLMTALVIFPAFSVNAMYYNWGAGNLGSPHKITLQETDGSSAAAGKTVTYSLKASTGSSTYFILEVPFACTVKTEKASKPNSTDWGAPNGQYWVDLQPGNYRMSISNSFVNSFTITCHIHETVPSTEYKADGEVCEKISLAKCRTCALSDPYVDPESRSTARGSHAYAYKVVAPTCTAKGYTFYSCSNCKHTKKTDEKAAAGHKWTVTTHDSYKHYLECSVCGQTSSGSHTMASVGSYSKCSVCGRASASTDYGSINFDDQAAPTKPKKLVITRFASNLVNITLTYSDGIRYNPTTVIKAYAGTKLIKTINVKNTDTCAMFTYKAAGAGKANYRFDITNASGKSVSVSMKPAANLTKKTVKYNPSKKASSYASMANTWMATKLVKNGSKYTVSGFFVNNHIIKLGYIKCKINVEYVDAKGNVTKIGSKTISSGSIKAQSTKSKGFTIKSSKNVDLKNGGYLRVSRVSTNWKY